MSPLPVRTLVLLLALTSSAALAEVPAEFSGDASQVQLSIRGVAHPNLRVRPGGSAVLTLTGPGRVTVELREEALSPRQEAYLLQLDGKPVGAQQINSALDTAVRSEKGLALSRPLSLPLAIAAGRHVLKLQWPMDAAGDALLELAGAAVAAPLPELALPPLTGGAAKPA